MIDTQMHVTGKELCDHNDDPTGRHITIVKCIVKKRDCNAFDTKFVGIKKNLK